MSHDAFVSYSSRDKAVADAACATLEERRVRCWIAPRDVVPGTEYGDAIIRAISECRVFVLVFSSTANESPQVRREVERAVSKGKVVIPVRIEDVMPSEAMEYHLSNTHWLDALTPPLESHLRRLAEVVVAVLGIVRVITVFGGLPVTQIEGRDGRGRRAWSVEGAGPVDGAPVHRPLDIAERCPHLPPTRRRSGLGGFGTGRPRAAALSSGEPFPVSGSRWA